MDSDALFEQGRMKIGMLMGRSERVQAIEALASEGAADEDEATMATILMMSLITFLSKEEYLRLSAADDDARSDVLAEILGSQEQSIERVRAYFRESGPKLREYLAKKMLLTREEQTAVLREDRIHVYLGVVMWALATLPEEI